MTATNNTATVSVFERLTCVIDGQLVTVSVEQIGPKWAHEALSRNTHNRTLRPRLVAALTRDMADGHFMFAGTPVVFSDTGVLVDGQHRLTAIVQSGATVPVLVVRGVKANVQAAIDTGAKRTFGDVLTLRGLERGKDLSALVRAAFLWERGYRTVMTNLTPTNAELLEFLDDNQDLHGCIEVVEQSVRKWRMVRSKSALAYWLFKRIDHEEATAFWQAMAVPEPDMHHPIGALQARMVKEMGSGGASGGMTNDYQLALIIKAWNALMRGESVHNLRWRQGGIGAEKFPEPISPVT